ncbi:putative leucine-rich repeat-containing, plant-type, leucine-rich repeat domain, L [Medicago truncatula]|uniref:Putative leucine-rich repeat-containing, plant-type, leucine-rich repeat domain, L n=1 Tax=Medicago truncatula TaxID=3880 RepID=G7JR94_MEDTR|nr:receptor-like protein 6 [Medicago truncatula]AES87007.1 verticillium wilt resistance-like protein [Medicago truncatula]RHN58978.1 putative leucine-rich repeat-containing, plant-type, leucine-rich repeat domain, L [Medicago truncatula]
MRISFLLCYYCIYITHASAICLEDQQSLLLQFKKNLTFHPEGSTKLILWNKTTACCNWSGVTCDNEGHVIGLDLSDEDIHGGFNDSSSLFNLLHLKKLNLAYNNFNSLIPSGFSKLEKLTYLNLSKASFVGQIPIEISQLTRLVTLDLSFDVVRTKPNIPNLQKFIQNLTNIRQLYLDGITITSQRHKWSNALIPLRDLQELSMSNCDLSGSLDSSLSRLQNLSVIILYRNNFSSSLPETFANFKNLTTLNLRKCGLIGTFPQKIFQIRTLSVIDLSGNPNLQVFFPDYSLSESLHSIILRNTSFSGPLPHNIGNMTNLLELDLSYCQLYGTLPNSLSNLTQLIWLDLSHNDLSGVIPSYLFTLPSLEEIYLASNQFSKFDEFINVSSNVMEFLDLSSNNLSGPFPTSIFQLRSLSFLYLSSNRLNGSLQLDELLKLSNLLGLDLSYNNISINENDANADQTAFPNFELLYLSSCNLKTFPRFLRNQSTLLSLDLSHNQIQGAVPNWIWKLQSLQQLNISHNFLTELEGSLQNLTSIWVLDLHNNQIQGTIPVFPEFIQYLDYSTNKFSVIPHDIGNYLSSILYLSLSNNNLHGTIPHSLFKASNLQVLDISFNNISGTIPPCLITMTSTLQALNLRNNNLNSSIPDMFPTSCVASSLNFHGNLLHGPIPKSLSHCSSLKLLDIGSNQIVGGFPCFVKNIPTLSVLVLRNNKLHGSIECSHHSLENKPWKMIQIVDIAFNNFNGKLQEKYFATWEKMKNDENNVLSDFIHTGERTDYTYYQDSVTISTKGQVMQLLKILTIFTAIDFSSNHFEGPIPHVLMEFKAIHFLNFSNNGFYGEIPSTIANLKQLESLDLSNNSLVGEIPVQLASLSFLSYLNLSLNHLVGKIPTGTQLQSFEASSFRGNDGLYGPPLNATLYCKKQDELHPQPACERFACSIERNFLSVELGFIFGLGIIVGPLLFWKKWRVSYWKLVDKILCLIFRRMHFEYVTDRGQTYRILRW